MTVSQVIGPCPETQGADVDERDALAADNAALRVEIAQLREERDALAAELDAHKRLNADLEASDIRLRDRVQVLEELLRESERF